MSDLQVFSNPEFGQVRSVMVEDSPWFVGADAAKALAYNRTADALKAHVDDEDKRLVRVGEIPTLKVNNYGAYIINESGLYSLIFSSKLPSAKRFKRWVTSEVLPALRKTGRYQMEGSKDTSAREITTDDYIRAASIVATCRNERLPYVLNYLRQAGIDVRDMKAVQERPANALIAEEPSATAKDVMRELNTLHNRGMTDGKIADALDEHRNTIRRWRIGLVTPRAGRCPQLYAALKTL